MRRGARCDDDKQNFEVRRGLGGLLEISDQYWVNENDNSCLYYVSYTREHIPTGEEPMIAGNCFSAVAYLSLRFTQPPQRYAPRRLYLLLKRTPYKTRTKFNFFHGPKYIRFVSPRSFSLFPSRPPVLFDLPPSLPSNPVRSTQLVREVIKLCATRYDVTQNCKRQTLWSIH